MWKRSLKIILKWVSKKFFVADDLQLFDLTAWYDFMIPIVQWAIKYFIVHNFCIFETNEYSKK